MATWQKILDNSQINFDQISDAVDMRHVRNTDTALDKGGTNEVVVADIKDAVDKRHVRNTDTALDMGGTNEVSVADIKDAVDKRHVQNTDTILDMGGTNEVSVADIKDAVDKRHVQNTDTHLARGTTDEVSAAQAKLAYDKIDKHQYLDYGGVNQVSAQTIKADLPQQQSGSGTANFTMTIPAGRRISFIIVKNTGENAVTINIGTTSGGNDVWEGTVGGKATTDCGVMYANAIQQRFFSYTSDQTLYISSANWNSASVTVYIVTQRVV